MGAETTLLVLLSDGSYVFHIRSYLYMFSCFYKYFILQGIKLDLNKLEHIQNLRTISFFFAVVYYTGIFIQMENKYYR